eukprot:m.754792 g.754792  ORF g.754792 m.754792 type:complete len:131 (-) comp23177_c2_seq3:128-520(-)
MRSLSPICVGDIETFSLICSNLNQVVIVNLSVASDDNITKLKNTKLLGRYDVLGARMLRIIPEGSSDGLRITDVGATDASSATHTKSAAGKLVLTLTGSDNLADVVLQCARRQPGLLSHMIPSSKLLSKL